MAIIFQIDFFSVLRTVKYISQGFESQPVKRRDILSSVGMSGLRREYLIFFKFLVVTSL
jgi:hypothetical protein